MAILHMTSASTVPAGIYEDPEGPGDLRGHGTFVKAA